MKRKFILLTLLAVGLPVFYFLVQYTSVTKPVGQATSQEEWADELIFAGQISAKKQVDLKFASSGKLAWVGVEEGDRVKKSQAIASLDQRELQKLFKKEMHDYLNERWDFEQTQDDYQDEKDNHLITDDIKRILEKAQFDLDSAVLDVEIKQLAIEYATIYSPIEGIVTAIDQPIAGVHITPATAVFTVVDPNSLYFEAEVDEEEISQVKKGNSAKVILDAYPDQEFESEIKRISFAPISGKSNPVYAVESTLPSNTDLRFRLGMGGEIEIND